MNSSSDVFDCIGKGMDETYPGEQWTRSTHDIRDVMRSWTTFYVEINGVISARVGSVVFADDGDSSSEWSMNVAHVDFHADDFLGNDHDRLPDSWVRNAAPTPHSTHPIHHTVASRPFGSQMRSSSDISASSHTLMPIAICYSAKRRVLYEPSPCTMQ